MAEVFEEIDIEGDYNRHAARLCKAIEYVLARTDKSVHERILALHSLFRVRGEITLPTGLGW
jgi:hypothetical protein